MPEQKKPQGGLDAFFDAARQVYNQVPPNVRFLGEALVGRTAPITEKDFTPTQLGAIRGQVERQKGLNAAQKMGYESELMELTPEKYAAGQKQGDYRYNWGTIDDQGNFKQAQFMPYGDYMRRVQNRMNSYTAHPEVTSVAGYKPQDTGLDHASWGATLNRTFNDPDYQVATSLGRFKATDTPQGTIVRDRYNFDTYKTEADEKLTPQMLVTKPVQFADTYMRKYQPGYSRDVNINIGQPDPRTDSWYRSVMGMPARQTNPSPYGMVPK